MTTTTDPATQVRRRSRTPLFVGILGVLVVPMLLSLAMNTWNEAPDAADYVRMALSNVAGSVIAACTMVGLAIAAWVSEPRRNATLLTVAAVGLIALACSTASLVADSLVANI